MFRSRVIRILAAASLIGWFGAAPVLAQSPAQVGQWASPPALPFYPVHAHMLPNGKVMISPGDGVSGNDTRSWDPGSHTVSNLALPGFDMFCGAHTFLADGRVFVAGGHIQNYFGLRRARAYDPYTNAWGANAPNMNAGRWYPTTTALANGDVLVLSGQTDLTVGVNTLPQVYRVATNKWRNLTGARLALDLYPIVFLAPNGKVFNAAPTEITRYLDTAGSGAWSLVAYRPANYRPNASAVMYAPGKVLVVGGGYSVEKQAYTPTNTAEVIDLNQASPSWRAIPPMQYAREYPNATLLPDGKVLVTGGTQKTSNDETGAVHVAEAWNPTTETWTSLATSAGIPRVYHSAALLLPDGRVLSTGGNNYPQPEVYSPPYLFKGARPTVTSAPSSVAYGQSFTVQTPDAATITRVTMIRLSSVTHSFNMGQYISELSIVSRPAGGLTVRAPAAAAAVSPPTVAPRGPYMLFVITGDGVPSSGRIMRLG
jgi:Domain of unknown function (DUF1929)/Glyoxal oxidase N-terminus/Kelch motif